MQSNTKIHRSVMTRSVFVKKHGHGSKLEPFSSALSQYQS